MTWLVPYLVFFHVLGVIFAFGPTYSYSIFGSFLKDEPQHRDYFARARDKVSRQMTWPATLSLAVTGVLIIIAGGYQVHTQPMRWLLLAIVLYVGMVLCIRFVLDPLNRRISERGRAARTAAAAGAGGPPGGRPPGPPPEPMQMVARTRRDGKLVGVVVIVILFLMVVTPGFPV